MKKYYDQEEWREEVALRLASSRKAVFASTYEAAKAVGVGGQSSVAMWETVARVPTTYNFINIAKAYQKHPAFLAGLTDDIVYPEGINLREKKIDQIGLHRGYLKTAGIAPEAARYCVMHDQGLTGYIEAGELLIVDGSIKAIQEAGTYVVYVDNNFLIRQFSVLNEEKVSMTSTTPDAFPSEELSISNVKVIGKVKRAIKDIK